MQASVAPEISAEPTFGTSVPKGAKADVLALTHRALSERAAPVALLQRGDTWPGDMVQALVDHDFKVEQTTRMNTRLDRSGAP